MPFVVDASVAACWLLPDEGAAAAELAYARFPDDTAVVPTLWWFEMRNIFIVSEHRGRIDSSRTSVAMALLRGLPIRIDSATDEDLLLALARRHGLTAYDAAYLELALRLGVPLASLDEALVRATHAEGVEIIGAS
jgi:predicted nucleic acid-binding protein